MKRSSSRLSSAASPRDRPGPATGGVDVYLLPSVIGGGRGDVEEVLLVGRALARTGHRVLLYRSRPLALLHDRSFDRTGVRRTSRVVPRARRAVTLSAQFGLSAADGRDEPLGRPGTWAVERAEIERAYGPDQVLHLSLEEFARARPSAALAEERWRESGRSAHARRAARRSDSARREVEEFRRLFRKFRALDRPDLLAIFPTFLRSRTFASEFPESVQAGPAWPEPLARGPGRHRPGALRVLWYASPSTSERLAPRLISGLVATGRPVQLRVRSPRPIAVRSTGRVQVVAAGGRSPAEWRSDWREADRVIVTGSRSLLEALAWGVPFLYFNGVMGRGRSVRRHRPEKLLSLLAALRIARGSPQLHRDLAAFSRLRDVEGVVARWLDEARVLGPSVRRAIDRGFPPPFRDAGGLIGSVVDRFAAGGSGASQLVREVRRESRRRISKV